MSLNKVYAIILNYNSAQDTCELYDQLNEFYPELNIIVVDNMADQIGRQALVSYIPNDQLILNDDNLGYAGGNNVGTEKAMELGAEYIWILNPDIRIAQDTLPLLLETIETDDKIAVVGPRICFRNDNDLIYSDGGLMDSKTLATKHRNSRKRIQEIENRSTLFDSDYIDGSSMLMNAQALKEVGLMYDFFFLYFEETEWCVRAKLYGWMLKVNTKAKAYQTSSPKNSNYHYYTSRNRLILSKIILNNSRYVYKKELRNIIVGFSYSLARGKPKFKEYLFKLNGFYDGITFRLSKSGIDEK